MGKPEPTPEERAEEKIAQARHDGATMLNLGGLGLTTLPESLGQLMALQGLSLSNNQLTTLPESLGQLTALRELSLANNQLTTLPESLGQLTALRELSLANNQLTKLPESLGQLTALQDLSLANNQLTTLPESLGRLTALKELYLDYNQLTTLPESLGQLTALQILHLHNNQLTTLPESLGKLTALGALWLHDNYLSTLPESLGKLTALDILTLSNNWLSTLPESLEELSALRGLFLHGNGLGLPRNILGPTLEWVREDQDNYPARPRDILAYYFKTRQKARPLNEVKLLLVGRGKAGKSSIRDRLLHDAFDPLKAETPGIDIQHWSLDCGPGTVHVHVWDFAGQEITHATHQFFLTERSVYLLVLDGRSDTHDRDAEYWLRLIDGFGKGSPVIVALNQWDEKAFAVDEHALRERYPAIRTFLRTDCQTRLGIPELEEELRTLLRDWKEVHEPFPAAWWGVKERLTKPEKNYIPFEQYRTLCDDKKITDPEEQARLARILHALGVILHYADDARLRDTTVLNPHWVTTGVYTLLRLKDRPDTDGTLTVDEAAAALPAEPREMVRYLIGLMRRFELCYPLDEAESRWLVPQLLERFQPALGEEWKAADATRLRYRYKVVPEGLLPRFIVRTHPLGEGELRWRNGVVLRLDDALALVRAEIVENRVSVVAIGEPKARLRLVKLVRSHFAAMHADLPGLNAKEELEVEGYPGIFKDVRVLEGNERQGAVTTVDVDDVSVQINATAHLNRVSAPAARDPEQPRVNLFVSYSHTDRSLLEVFAPNLEVMKADGLVRVWTDGQIPPSAEWDRDIRHELEEADIIVLMVSVAFLSRPYIRGVELGRAIQRKTAGEAEIFILVLEPQCPWKQKRKVKQRVKDAATGAVHEEEIEVELGKYRALLPRNPGVQRWPKSAGAFNHVDAALREMIVEVLLRMPAAGASPRGALPRTLARAR